MKRILVIIVLFSLSITARAQIEINQFRTDNLKLFYLGKDISYLIQHTGRCFENSLDFHKKYWDYKPSESTTLFFNDFTDVGNGGANVTPFNFIITSVAPFDYTFSVLPANERMQWLMSHEITHVVMCDKAARSDRLFRTLFLGKTSPSQDNPVSLLYAYLSTPRWYSPRWYHEGIATFMETWMSGGMGRVLGGYDEMVFRGMVKDNAYFYRPIGLESEGTAIDFQVGVNSYLYGTRFFAYLANQYGVDKIRDFCARSDTSRRFYARQFHKVFDTKITTAWDQWVAWEQDHQKKNLKVVEEYPLTSFRPIIEQPLGSASRMYYSPSDSLVFMAVNYPKHFAHICAISLKDGSMKKLTNVNSPFLYFVTSLAYDDSTKTLFLSDKNTNWRGLKSLDTKTGKCRKLIKLSRSGDFAFNTRDRSLYAIQTVSGRVNIVRFQPPYKKWSDIYHLPFGNNLFDLDVSPDGKYLSATMADVNGKQKLILFNLQDLNQGKTDYTVLYEFEDNDAANFIFSKDGKYMYGTSFYTGVSNVFRINLESKSSELISNTDVGFFRPCEISPDSLLVYSYTHKGLIPGIIPVHPINDANAIGYLGQEVFKRNPELENWMLKPPSKINIDSLTRYQGRFKTIRGLETSGGYPIIQGYKNYVSYGYHLEFTDRIFFHNLKLNVGYSPTPNPESLPEKEKWHLSGDYAYRNISIFGTYNYADFYDLFGETKLSRAGYSYGASFSRDITYMTPFKYGYSFQASHYGDLESMPEFQDVRATESNMSTATISYRQSFIRKSLGAIDAEQGYDWRIYGQGVYVGDHFFPKIFSRFDLGFLLPMKNSSFWVRTAAGNGFAERDNPFSAFYFGSFGYNYIDTKSGSRQNVRDLWSFPGVDISEVGGKNFARVKTEWNLSPLRFRKMGFLWFYVTYAKLTIFGSGIGTNLDDKNYFSDTYNSGAQLDLELVLFSLMKSTLSLGYARSYQDHFKPREEMLVTLRLL